MVINFHLNLFDFFNFFRQFCQMINIINPSVYFILFISVSVVLGIFVHNSGQQTIKKIGTIIAAGGFAQIGATAVNEGINVVKDYIKNRGDSSNDSNNSGKTDNSGNSNNSGNTNNSGASK